MIKLLVIAEKPDKEDILMKEPFASRAGQLFLKQLDKADISREAVRLTYLNKPNIREPQCKIKLWEEIKSLPDLKVIMPLGVKVTELLLKTKIKVFDNWTIRLLSVDYTKAVIAPWYSCNYVLSHCSKVKETLDWLLTIRREIERV